MEVFVAYTKDDIYQLLEQTLNAWGACDWAEVKAIEINNNGRYEISRRVVADGLSTGSHYILADIGCVPSDTRVIPQINRKLTDKDGFIALAQDTNPNSEIYGVRICKKGVIEKWPQANKLPYDTIHAAAIKAAGKKADIWHDITYKRLQEC